VLLLADHLGDTVTSVRDERFAGMLEQVRTARGGRRGHGGREVDEPAGVDGEAAHHLEGSGGVLGADGDAGLETGVDDPLAEHVVGIEQLGRPLRLGGTERADRFPVGPRRGHRHHFSLGVAQRGELAAEHAAGVDADRVVHPLGFGNRGVAVHDNR
jgi:hypothetical protein